MHKLKIDESKGEVICSKCNGEGVILHNNPQLLDYMCPKCDGSGKVDWVSNTMQKEPVFSLEQLALDKSAKLLREEIDKKILEDLKMEVNKYI